LGNLQKPLKYRVSTIDKNTLAMALDECPKTEFQLKENFLTVEQSETYLCRVFDFLEEVSPRLKCRNSKTWKIRPHHSLKDTYIDPIPQLYPRTKPNLVATRGAGWVLSDLREYVTDHQIVRNYFVDKESYSGNDFICTIEGFTVLRPDDDLTNCNLGSCEKHPCWRDSSLRVVISLNSNSSLDDILVNVYGDRLSMKQGSLLMVPDRTQIGLRYVKCDRGYAPEGNELILFVHFSIHVGTEEIDRGRRIQDYFFARTFSQNGDVLEEGKDNFEWNLDNDKGYKPEKRKVRMIKAYQHTSICGHRKLSARQLQLHGLVFNCTNTDSVKEVEQSLSRLGIFYEDDYAKLHSQVTILQCSEVKSLAGQDKYLGGVSSPCGRYVYGIPGYAQRVLRITVSTGNVDMIGDSWGKGPFKWLRGVPIPSSVMGEKYPSGVCIGIPCCAKSILRIDPDTNEVVTFGHEQLSSFGKWLYHGGDLANDGFLYAVPANAPQVLRIDPRRMECSFVGPSFDGVQKWYGGLMASNGSIYGT